MAGYRWEHWKSLSQSEAAMEEKLFFAKKLLAITNMFISEQGECVVLAQLSDDHTPAETTVPCCMLFAYSTHDNHLVMRWCVTATKQQVAFSQEFARGCLAKVAELLGITLMVSDIEIIS